MAFYDEVIIKISCGFSHMLALSEENLIYGWGANEDGNCGVKSQESYLILPWKINIDWKLEFHEETFHIQDIKCGGGHSLILTNDNQVYSCGSNIQGQLG